MTQNDRNHINKRPENRLLLRRMNAVRASVETTPYKGVLLGAYL